MQVLHVFSEEYLGTPEKELTYFLTQWVDSLIWTIERHFIIFKHPSYIAEREIRLVTTGKHLDGKSIIKHRVSKNRIIPYLSTKDLSKNGYWHLPLKEIIVSPLANDDSTVSSIKKFLDNTGYCNIPVNLSALPFRG